MYTFVLLQHYRTTSRQRSSRYNVEENPTHGLERRGYALPHIRVKRSYAGCATATAQCRSAARMARVWCFHISSLQLVVVQPSCLHYRDFLVLGAQSYSFLRALCTLLADTAALLLSTSCHFSPTLHFISAKLFVLSSRLCGSVAAKLALPNFCVEISHLPETDFNKHPIMATLAVPNATTASSKRPLSTHGMPKPPRITSPSLPHRFSASKSPTPSFVSGFASPRSLGPMSPPMSAKSFGTFIDSEPSTPAYSPRLNYEWDDSTFVLLRPLSSSSEPSSPTEPVWDMVPMDSSQQPSNIFGSDKKGPLVTAQQPFFGTRLAPAPTRKLKMPRRARPVKDTKSTDVPQEEANRPHREGESEKTVEDQDPPVDTNTAPFGKLASKMKLMLRRKSATSDKKKERKEKEKDYYDPEEYLHWSER